MLFWLVLLLAVLAFVQAVVFFPWLMRSRDGGDEVLVADVNLPETQVRIFLSPGPPTLLLKTALDLPAADRLAYEDLDRRLFPGGPAHEYLVLFVMNQGEAESVLPLRSTPPVLVTGEGRETAPIDLAAAVRAHEKELPAYLRVYLAMLLPKGPEVRVAPGARRRILFAYPRGAAPAEIRVVRLGEARLAPHLWSKDDLDARLEEPRALLRAERP